jgi:thioredoxin reductase
MEERSMVIIGAGIGGLTAGCYAQMNDVALWVQLTPAR